MIVIFIVVILVFILFGCSKGSMNSYKHISQEEAKEMMLEDDDHIVVDVRTTEEYNQGHIPGAICIPNETINSEKPKELSNLDQIILIYCRSGNRSKQAAQKLFNMGYTNIYEFGGINTWTGDIVKEEEVKEMRNIKLMIDSNEVNVDWEDNDSIKALIKELDKEDIIVKTSIYGGFEQVGSLGVSLTRNDTQTTTEPGDIMLYSGNQIVIFFDSNSWSYTRLGKINLSQEELIKILDKDTIELILSLE